MVKQLSRLQSSSVIFLINYPLLKSWCHDFIFVAFRCYGNHFGNGYQGNGLILVTKIKKILNNYSENLL